MRQGDVQIINYGKESVTGSAGSVPGQVDRACGSAYLCAMSTPPKRASDNSGLSTTPPGRSYGLILPNVFQVVVNQGDTVVLAMVRNSNTVYRVIKLNDNQFPTSTAAISAIGAADCEPLNVPVYCVVPLNTGTAVLIRSTGLRERTSRSMEPRFMCSTAARSAEELHPA